VRVLDLRALDAGVGHRRGDGGGAQIARRQTRELALKAAHGRAAGGNDDNAVAHGGVLLSR
jgi:hypothetical protein